MISEVKTSCGCGKDTPVPEAQTKINFLDVPVACFAFSYTCGNG